MREFTAEELLNMSDEELEKLRDPLDNPLGTFDFYVESMLAHMEKHGRSLEEALLHAWNTAREHDVFCVKAAQYIRREGLEKLDTGQA